MADFLLKEDGGYLLQESGFKILLSLTVLQGIGYVLGLNKNTSTGIGARGTESIGRNKNTGTGIGTKLN